MLASAPFYMSGTFWAAAAIPVGLATVVVPVILWRLGTPRRMVTYSTPIAMPLLSRHWPGMPPDRMQLIVEGEVLADPYVVVLRIHNRARRDIRSSDFDQGKPLEVDLGTEVLSAVADGPWPEQLKMGRTGFALGPMLIAGRSQLELTFITKGRPAVRCRSFLVNVRLRETGTDRHRRRYFVADVVSTLCLIGSVLAMVITAGMDSPARVDVAYALLPVAATSFTTMQWASWRSKHLA